MDVCDYRTTKMIEMGISLLVPNLPQHSMLWSETNLSSE